ncbi:protein trichome birefringence-like 34 isoform X2 [Eucalyptus grandis]|uniref:protein trichome birefringence-like 34 isoform X2 n=1 Tax=Eucalyptus grandis TaxID=71139 RepID=UPI00192E9E95|nr:protein trichome birefringence-like 34 isoform X2 [Eucalyptus grandis]
MVNKTEITPATWGVRSSFHSLVALLVASVVVAVLSLARDGSRFRPLPDDGASLQSAAGATTSCDLFSGRWVYDNASYPLYEEKQCTFVSDQVACEKFGRKDLGYRHWRWQPHGCDIPRFNATWLLERLRNKRLVYVGDSLNRGQWVSMICLVESAIPPNLKWISYRHNHSLIAFNAMAIEKHARVWSDADILIFNSYLWWLRPEIKVLWGSFGSPDGIHKMEQAPRVYEMALNTWSDWLEVHINRSKTQVFFVSMSPTHDRAEDWGGLDGHNCYQETEPITREGYSGSGSRPELMRAVEAVIGRLRARGLGVRILNITQLSEYRKDAHPSIYKRQWHPLSREQLADPTSYADCFHWCLPGVSDVWNELLYAYILRNRSPC